MITIIMAVYNGQEYIREQLESLKDQTYTEWRLVIRDDRSSDKTAEIVKKFSDEVEQEVIFKVNEKPSGSAKNNFALLINDAKESDYVMFCDQDDIWHTIDFPIKKIGNHPLRMEAVKKSSSAENEKYIAHQLTDYINCFQAVTHYHVLYSTDKWSAIKLKLDTGRTHQIRVHMQAIGHPLLGDSIYNTSTMNREQCTIYRAALHAWKVRLRQPFNGRKIELEVPVPEDFKKYGGFYVSSGS